MMPMTTCTYVTLFSRIIGFLLECFLRFFFLFAMICRCRVLCYSLVSFWEINWNNMTRGHIMLQYWRLRYVHLVFVRLLCMSQISTFLRKSTWWWQVPVPVAKPWQNLARLVHHLLVLIQAFIINWNCRKWPLLSHISIKKMCGCKVEKVSFIYLELTAITVWY